MFREKLFEWSRIFHPVLNPWAEAKTYSRIRQGTAPSKSAVAKRVDGRMFEANRDRARAYIRPIQTNL